MTTLSLAVTQGSVKTKPHFQKQRGSHAFVVCSRYMYSSTAQQPVFVCVPVGLLQAGGLALLTRSCSRPINEKRAIDCGFNGLFWVWRGERLIEACVCACVYQSVALLKGRSGDEITV